MKSIACASVHVGGFGLKSNLGSHMQVNLEVHRTYLRSVDYIGCFFLCYTGVGSTSHDSFGLYEYADVCAIIYVCFGVYFYMVRTFTCHLCLLDPSFTNSSMIAYYRALASHFTVMMLGELRFRNCVDQKD